MKDLELLKREQEFLAKQLQVLEERRREIERMLLQFKQEGWRS